MNPQELSQTLADWITKNPRYILSIAETIVTQMQGEGVELTVENARMKFILAIQNIWY